MNISDEDKDYLIKLGKRESDYRPNVTNSLGYYGLYQFGKPALETIGATKEDFANSTLRQHQGALKIAQINARILKPILDTYVGKEYKGNKITRNGILAAAHLLGAGTVKDYFNGTTKTSLARKGFKDAYGTSITEYLNMYS